MFLSLALILFSVPTSYSGDCLYSDPNSCDGDSYCSYTNSRIASCLPKFLLEPPLIAFPFHSHHTVTCDQGNTSPDGNSHTHWNTQFALDLHTPQTGPGGTLFAGVSGRVIAFDECWVIGDYHCGADFGNHVKILTPDGFVVLYAHLARVDVKTGQNVLRGDVIGLEGQTGGAGKDNPHVHLSVHYDWRPMGFEYWKDLGFLPTSVPYRLEHRRPGCEGTGCRMESLSSSLPCIRKEGYSLELHGL